MRLGFEVETFLNVRALAAGLRVVEVASFESPASTATATCGRSGTASRVLRTIARERRRLRRARAGLGVPRPVARTIERAGGRHRTPTVPRPLRHPARRARRAVVTEADGGR